MEKVQDNELYDTLFPTPFPEKNPNDGTLDSASGASGKALQNPRNAL